MTDYDVLYPDWFVVLVLVGLAATMTAWWFLWH